MAYVNYKIVTTEINLYILYFMTAGKHISCAGELQLLVYIQVKEVSYLPGLQMLNVFDIQFQCCIAPAQVKKKNGTLLA